MAFAAARVAPLTAPEPPQNLAVNRPHQPPGRWQVAPGQRPLESIAPPAPSPRDPRRPFGAGSPMNGLRGGQDRRDPRQPFTTGPGTVMSGTTGPTAWPAPTTSAAQRWPAPEAASWPAPGQDARVPSPASSRPLAPIPAPASDRTGAAPGSRDSGRNRAAVPTSALPPQAPAPTAPPPDGTSPSPVPASLPWWEPRRVWVQPPGLPRPVPDRSVPGLVRLLGLPMVVGLVVGVVPSWLSVLALVWAWALTARHRLPTVRRVLAPVHVVVAGLVLALVLYGSPLRTTSEQLVWASWLGCIATLGLGLYRVDRALTPGSARLAPLLDDLTRDESR